MRTAPKLMSTVVAAAILFGLTGMSSVANATESNATESNATASSPAGATASLVWTDLAPLTGAEGLETTPAPDDEVTAQGTRQFVVTNLSGHTLTLSRAWGTTGWPQTSHTGFDLQDQAPMVGSVLKPGGQMRFEVRDWSNHGINAQFKSDNGQDAYLYMHVSGLSRYSAAQGLAGQFNTGGGTIEILDAPGSVVDIPAADSAAQQAAINNLCDKSGAKCTFTPTSKHDKDEDGNELLGPEHPFGRGIANRTTINQVAHFSETDTVGTTDSLEISATVKATIMGAVETSLTSTYGHTWSTTHGFTQSYDLTIAPGHVGWLTVSEPIIRVTGDIKIKIGNTTWTLRGVVFDLPNPDGRGLVDMNFAPLSDKERKSKDTYVEAPWASRSSGVNVQHITGQAADIEIDGIDVPA